MYLNITSYKKDKNEYFKQAYNFCKNTHTNIYADFRGARFPEWDKDAKHNFFYVRIERGEKIYKFMFFDSRHNTQKYNIETFGVFPRCGYPCAYDILTCLQKYDCGTFEEFCAIYGYDEDSRKAEQIYNACKEEFANVQRLYNDKEIEELQKIK